MEWMSCLEEPCRFEDQGENDAELMAGAGYDISLDGEAPLNDEICCY